MYVETRTDYSFHVKEYIKCDTNTTFMDNLFSVYQNKAKINILYKTECVKALSIIEIKKIIFDINMVILCPENILVFTNLCSAHWTIWSW